MRLLAIVAYFSMFLSVPQADWEGDVLVDPNGVHHLYSGDKPKGWSYPVRSYLLGSPIRYSSISRQALQDIPGIGPSIASKIMRLRTEKPHATWSDLDAIPGIGEKKLSLLQNSIILSD